MSEASNTRVRSRKSGVTGPSITSTLFTRDELANDEGGHLKAMRAYQTQALEDPYMNLYAANATALSVIQPPYNPQSLLKLPNECSTLRQCIDAMVTNISSFGHRLEYVGPEGQEDSPASQAEKDRITGLTDQPNGEYTFTELRERLRRDVETFGYTFMEVGRETDRSICMMNHVPAHTMRMTNKETEPVVVTQWLWRNGNLIQIKVRRRFRRFVQQVGARVVYFKEFGDPRPIDPKTGQVNEQLSIDEQATEIYLFTLYTPGTAYALPRWINTLPAIVGNRESELTNLQFFKDNAIPAMAVLVSGGALTNDSMGNIEAHFTQSRGRGSMHRVLVIEATGDETAAKVDGQIAAPKLELKPLVSERQKDGHFKEYEEANEKKIRAAFRLPPLFVGRADDYTRATADTSLVVADGQVFGPERNKDDDVFNAHFLTVDGKPLQFWRMRSNPPRLANPEAVLKAIEVLDQVGGLTPNIAIGIANELFDLAVPMIEEAWGDYPFPIVTELNVQGRLIGVEEIAKDVTEGLAGANKPDPKDDPAVNPGSKDDPVPLDDETDPAKKSAAVATARIRRRVVGAFSSLAQAA